MNQEVTNCYRESEQLLAVAVLLPVLIVSDVFLRPRCNVIWTVGLLDSQQRWAAVVIAVMRATGPGSLFAAGAHIPRQGNGQETMASP
jgi:hypothetical protein